MYASGWTHGDAGGVVGLSSLRSQVACGGYGKLSHVEKTKTKRGYHQHHLYRISNSRMELDACVIV